MIRTMNVIFSVDIGMYVRTYHATVLVLWEHSPGDHKAPGSMPIYVS